MPSINMQPLKLLGIFIALFGAVLCTAGFAATLGGVDAIFRLFHPGEGHPVWSEHMRFSTGLMGAVSLGWGLTFYAIAKHSADMGEATTKALWKSITIGMIVWFVIDGIISISNGYWVNAVSNTVIAILYYAALKTSRVFKN